VETLEGEKVSI